MDGLQSAAAYRQLQADYDKDKEMFAQRKAELEDAVRALRGDKKRLEVGQSVTLSTQPFTFLELKRGRGKRSLKAIGPLWDCAMDAHHMPCLMILMALL